VTIFILPIRAWKYFINYKTEIFEWSFPNIIETVSEVVVITFTLNLGGPFRSDHVVKFTWGDLFAQIMWLNLL